ncbi:MAG TPA: YidB family protein [Usitatibacter sp.]
MGLLDTIANQVMGSLASCDDGRHAQVVNAIGGYIQQQGGLENLINNFHQKGLGSVVSSWVGTGQNLPISADQLSHVLGNAQVQAMAQKLGFSPQEMSSHLSEILPQVIDKLTPGGNVPAGGGLASVLSMLKGTTV